MDIYGFGGLVSNELIESKIVSKDIFPISGDFDCSFNKLTSLVGCPIKVGGTFFCNDNKLVSLKGCPIKVGGNFNCYKNQLTNPVTIGQHSKLVNLFLLQ